MKTYFAEPSVEVIKFAAADVITASGDDGGLGEYDPNDPTTWPLIMPCIAS